MPVMDLALRHATLQEAVSASDSAGGRNVTWTALGAIKYRIGTIQSGLTRVYEREGWENVIRLQCPNELPVRIRGRKFLHELFLFGDRERLRIVIEARTLTPVSVRAPNERTAPGGNTFVNIDCIETPEGVGFVDD